MGEFRLVPVKSKNINLVWPDVAHIMARIQQRGTGWFCPDSAREHCDNGNWQLWLVKRENAVVAAAITGILDDKRKKVCEWIAVGGDGFKDWSWASAHIETWAKANGCEAMRMTGRMGWKKAMPPAYRVVGVVMERTLS